MISERSLHKIMRKDKSGDYKALFLAYDQGMEHGPVEFDDKNVDPQYILDIANKGGYTGIIFQKGVAEKYYNGKTPLILKLNGKTNLRKEEPYSPQIATVEEAVSLGAKAVGYTIYVGSGNEAKMFKEFGIIQRDAHANNLPVVAWMYPRGAAVKDDTSREILAYSARLGLELGADFIKIKNTKNPEDFKWVVKSAGKVKVVVSGGEKKDEKEFLMKVKSVMSAGASGMAIGRNIWQSKKPLELTKKISEIIFG